MFSAILYLSRKHNCSNVSWYLSQTRVAVKDCLWFSCRGLVTFHWNYQINMLLSHLGEMTKLLPVAVYQLNDTMHMRCHILVKCRDLHVLSHLAEMSRFTRFVVFGWNVAIYTLCCIWVKCRDLRALSHFGWNVAIYAFCQAQNVCSQAPKTILHPWVPPPGASTDKIFPKS